MQDTSPPQVSLLMETNAEGTWRRARARLASLVAQHAPEEEIKAARAEFRGIFTESRIVELIASAPELTAEQRVRLAGLLNNRGAS
jgi:hypothetical protein